MSEYFWLQVAAGYVVAELLGLRRWVFRKIGLISPLPSDSLLSAANQLSASVRRIQSTLPKAMGPISEDEINAVTAQARWPSSLKIRRAAADVNKSINEDAQEVQIDQFNTHYQFSDESLNLIKKRISKLENRLAHVQRKAGRGA